MADNSCTLNTKIYSTFSNKTPTKTESSAHDALSRLDLVAKGQEILARGQKHTSTDEEAIRQVRKRLNQALGDCEKLDENVAKYDKELERRVALFQERHLKAEKDSAGEKEVDGVVGAKTWNKLRDLTAPHAKETPSPTPPPERKVPEPVSAEPRPGTGREAEKKPEQTPPPPAKEASRPEPTPEAKAQGPEGEKPKPVPAPEEAKNPERTDTPPPTEEEEEPAPEERSEEEDRKNMAKQEELRRQREEDEKMRKTK